MERGSVTCKKTQQSTLQCELIEESVSPEAFDRIVGLKKFRHAIGIKKIFYKT